MKHYFLPLLSTLLFVACGRSSEKQSNIKDLAVDSQTSEISVKLDYSNLRDESNLHFNLNDGNVINIEPVSSKYETYKSGTDFEIEEVVVLNNDAPSEFIDYPRLLCYITNNSKEDLSVSRLSVNVENSELDKFPYLTIAAPAAYSNCIQLGNESWVNWGEATLEYTILKKGESFNGSYSESIKIPYFEHYYLIDFTNDLVSMGYDYNYVKSLDSSYSDEDPYNCICPRITDENLASSVFSPFEICYDGEDWYNGFARVYCKLSFKGSKFSVKFHGNITLSTSGDFGAGMEEDDSFDVQLEPDKKNYQISLPYTTTISPGTTEMIGITLMAPKSSKHVFTIEAINDNNITVKTKPINLYFLYPRHSSKSIWRNYY